LVGSPLSEPSAGLAARARDVRSRIERTCSRAGRDPAEVTLVAVTKTHPVEAIRGAIAAGLTIFGENRVQEGMRKIEALRPEFPTLSWRLIGRLQTNKAKTAVRYFEEIQSVDRPALLDVLSREAVSTGRTLPVYVEMNVGGEASKGGVAPAEVEGLVADAASRPGIELRGLMTVPPFSEDREDSRPFFRTLRETRDRIAAATGVALPGLSMGMSHDFEVAIEEGATVVRVGTAIFGQRASA
jgi:pyridoxal phosphate enzyme (YggS family)